VDIVTRAKMPFMHASNYESFNGDYENIYGDVLYAPIFDSLKKEKMEERKKSRNSFDIMAAMKKDEKPDGREITETPANEMKNRVLDETQPAPIPKREHRNLFEILSEQPLQNEVICKEKTEKRVDAGKEKAYTKHALTGITKPVELQKENNIVQEAQAENIMMALENLSTPGAPQLKMGKKLGEG
jgi:hypothetical protein